MHRYGVIIVLLMLLPLGSAGSPGDPEVTDAPGDTVNEDTGLPESQPSVDLRAVWFTETSNVFAVHVKVTDLTPPSPTRGQRWVVEWDANGKHWVVDIQRFASGSLGALRSPGVGDGPNTGNELATVTFDEVGDEITFVAPRMFTLDAASGPEAIHFAKGDQFVSPTSHADLGIGSVFVAAWTFFDHAGPGRTFTFVTPGDNLYSGRKPAGEDIDTSWVKLDGVSVHDQRGTGTFATYEFLVRTENKWITFQGTSTALHIGDDVLITNFHGNYIVTGGNTRFNGTADSVTITPS